MCHTNYVEFDNTLFDQVVNSCIVFKIIPVFFPVGTHGNGFPASFLPDLFTVYHYAIIHV